MQKGRQASPTPPWRVFAAFALLAGAATLLAWGFFIVLEERLRDSRHKQLSAMVQLKAGQIESWLGERRLDAEALAASPNLQENARKLLTRRDPVGATRLRAELETSRAIESAAGIEVLDRDGKVVLRVGSSMHAEPGPTDELDRVARQSHPLLIDLHRDTPRGPVHLAYVLGLRDGMGGQAPVVGYLRLNLNPEHYLYPLLRNWPLPGSSGENVLVRRDGEDVLYLNDLRYRQDSALNLRLPLANAKLAGARAILNPDGVFDGLDYRWEPVLSVSRHIAGTPWILMAKEDKAEVLGELRRLRTLFLALIVTASIFGALLWWQILRRQALQARHELETQLAAIAAAVPGAIYSFRMRPDGSACVPYASPPITDLYEILPEQVVEDAAPLFARIHPDDIPLVNLSIAASARQLSEWQCEFRILHSRRGEIWVEARSTPLQEADGSILWHGFVQDISARRRSEQALRQAEERYRTLLDNIPGAAFRGEVGKPWRLHLVSDGIEAISDYSTSEFLRPGGLARADLILPEDIPPVEAALRHGVANRAPYEIRYRIRRADGSIRWVSEKGRAVYGENGEPEWLDGVILDITARIEAETALQASSERWRQLAEAMPQLVWTCLPDGQCDYVNQHWSEYTGLPPAEQLGDAWLAVVHPEDRGRLARAWNQAIVANTPFDGEFRLRRSDGEYRWFKTRVLPVHDHANRLVKWYGSNTDIQELKEFETALHRSLLRQQGLHQLDRAILEASTPEEIAAKGLAHLAAMFPFQLGSTRTFDFAAGLTTLLAMRCSANFHDMPERRLSLAAYGEKDLAVLKTGRVCVVADLGAMPERPESLEQLYRLGIRSYMRVPLMAEGRLVGSLNLASEDIGHFGNAELEIAHPVADVLAIAMQQAFLRQHLANQATMLEQRVAERTAELARMRDKAEAASRAKSHFLANMSHELRTPLNSLLILSQLLADNVQDNLTPEQVGFARVIHDAGNDLLNLINDILDLSKIESGRTAVDSEEVPIASLLDYIERIFRPQAVNKGLRLDLTAAPDLPASLHSDPGRLKPILRNLVANAVKFTLHGSVSLHVRIARGGWRAGHPILGGAGTVLAFEVTDTGIGIAADKLPLIFDAFEQAEASTTRRFGGTGLGLHIARANAELLGGELAVTSIPDQGSTFTLFLPLDYAGPANIGAEAAPATSLPAAAASKTRLAGRTILVAEADPRSRVSLAALLEHEGMLVVTAGAGQEALELLASTPDIDALVMDIALPDMDARTALGAVRRFRQADGLPVIALTTGAMPDDGEIGLASYGAECLAKPVQAPKLLAALQTCLQV